MKRQTHSIQCSTSKRHFCNMYLYCIKCRNRRARNTAYHISKIFKSCIRGKITFNCPEKTKSIRHQLKKFLQNQRRTIADVPYLILVGKRNDLWDLDLFLFGQYNIHQEKLNAKFGFEFSKQIGAKKIGNTIKDILNSGYLNAVYEKYGKTLNPISNKISLSPKKSNKKNLLKQNRKKAKTPISTALIFCFFLFFNINGNRPIELETEANANLKIYIDQQNP